MPKISLYVKIKLGLIKVNRKSPMEYKFWRWVYKSGMVHPKLGKCWVWRGRHINGYGVIKVSDEYVQIHRYAYSLFVGEIPDKIQVLHSCNNRECTNPDHLFIGSYIHNIYDKGHKAKGYRRFSTDLTNAQVLEIRRLYIYGDDKITWTVLSRIFRVSPVKIRRIVQYKIYKHI